MQHPTTQGSPIISLFLAFALVASLFGIVLLTAMYGVNVVEQLMSLKTGLFQLASLLIYKG